MKILMVDKFYFVKGGVERYLFELKKILEEKDHTVIPFSMKHPRNEPSEYEDYFVENIEFNLESPWKKIINGPRIVARVLYSFHARRRLEKLIQLTKPDIAHLHMIDHQISPSIIHTLKKHKIPLTAANCFVPVISAISPTRMKSVSDVFPAGFIMPFYSAATSIR